MATKKDDLPVDELVKKLLPDGEKLHDLQSMYGFIGPNDSEDHITLYLDIHLHRSLSIRREDVLHSLKVTKSQNPLGGTLVWVKNGQDYLNYGSVESKEEVEAQAEAIQNAYLQGNIHQTYTAHQVGGPTTNPYYCPPKEEVIEETEDPK